MRHLFNLSSAFVLTCLLIACGSKTESNSNSESKSSEETSVSDKVILKSGCEFDKQYLTKYKTEDSNMFYEFRVIDGELKAFYVNNGREELIDEAEIDGCQILTFESGTTAGFEEIEGVKYFTFYIGGSGGGSTYYHPEYNSSKEFYVNKDGE